MTLKTAAEDETMDMEPLEDDKLIFNLEDK